MMNPAKKKDSEGWPQVISHIRNNHSIAVRIRVGQKSHSIQKKGVMPYAKRESRKIIMYERTAPC